MMMMTTKADPYAAVTDQNSTRPSQVLDRKQRWERFVKRWRAADDPMEDWLFIGRSSSDTTRPMELSRLFLFPPKTLGGRERHGFEFDGVVLTASPSERNRFARDKRNAGLVTGTVRDLHKYTPLETRGSVIRAMLFIQSEVDADTKATAARDAALLEAAQFDLPELQTPPSG